MYLLFTQNNIKFTITIARLTLFINVSGLEGRIVHDYLRTLYIIYQNYSK
jgi:hypothetical protein